MCIETGSLPFTSTPGLQAHFLPGDGSKVAVWSADARHAYFQCTDQDRLLANTVCGSRARASQPIGLMVNLLSVSLNVPTRYISTRHHQSRRRQNRAENPLTKRPETVQIGRATSLPAGSIGLATGFDGAMAEEEASVLWSNPGADRCSIPQQHRNYTTWELGVFEYRPYAEYGAITPNP